VPGLTFKGVTHTVFVISETLVRPVLPIIAALGILLGSYAAAQEAVTEGLVNPEIPQEERICDLEIDEVEALLDDNIEAFGRLEQSRLRQQLDEAQEFCDDGNEVMAAIRLEAVMAVIEVTGVAD
jgi:hypothetical protein